MLIGYPVEVLDADGVGIAGLTPTWSWFRNWSTGSAITPQPAVASFGDGMYRASYDPELYGEAMGRLDLGVAIADPGARYRFVFLPLDPSRLADSVAGFRPAVAGAALMAVLTGKCTGRGTGVLRFFDPAPNETFERVTLVVSSTGRSSGVIHGS